MMWKRLKNKLSAAFAFVVAGGSIAGYLVMMEPSEAEQFKQDLQELAIYRPDLAPLIADYVSVDLNCWDMGYYGVCRYGKLYGKGEGGTKPCTPDPERHEPIPCIGPSSDWPETVLNMSEKERLKILKQAVERLRRGKK